MKISTCSPRPIVESCGLENFNYQIDTYIGCQHFCYYCYALNKAETNWAHEIQIHENIINQLEDELHDIPPQKFYLGYNTDPYQPIEEELRQTRQVLQFLLNRGFSVGILTKSDLILRDLDLLTQMDNASVSFSIAFLDEKLRRTLEINTISTERRIEVLKKIKDAGIQTRALICPVIPFVNDVEPMIEILAPIVEKIWIYGLSFLDKSEINWKYFNRIISRLYPDKRDDIETAVFDHDQPVWHEIRTELETLQREKNLNLSIHV